MRPSQKSNRNRGKNNRPKSMGNVVNRVFESAGPEGKVRGTPQQIIEKYEQLARDSQTAGDRVTAENFLQHAEHYLRLLSAAQAEQQANSQPQQPRDRNDAQQKNDGDDDQPYIGGQGGRNSGQSGSANGAANGTANGHGGGAGSGSALETIDSSDDSDPLVATPEAESRGDAKPDAAGDASAEGAPAPRARAPRRRRPRRDKTAEGGDAPAASGDAPAPSGGADAETV